MSATAKATEASHEDNGGGRSVRYPIRTLGPCRIASPLGLSTPPTSVTPPPARAARGPALGPRYVDPDARVLEQVELAPGEIVDAARALEKAGPRQTIFFEPSRTRAAILTSGGLCPGTNNVIRAIVLELVHKYGIRSVLGIRFGFAGLDPASAAPPMPLGVGDVRHVHGLGGTILGTSRGMHDPEVMVDTLLAHGVGVLFAIGGDGTMRGAHAVAEAVDRRGLEIAVVGIPKTIDNDIPFVDKTFGFETAVSMAKVAIDAAHTEALSIRGGIGLVKLMGREAGFIAAYASIASHDVNVCLIPEVPFRLEGEGGLLAHLERRLAERDHAVVVVAEGCGLALAGSDGRAPPTDETGNPLLSSEALDVGRHLERVIGRYLTDRSVEHHFKYIDPSYTIRGVPADAIDALFCAELGRYAVHAAMAGKTDMMVGRLHRAFTHVPLARVLERRKRIDPEGELWLAVLESTGQPPFL